jgi:hypothetical protein
MRITKISDRMYREKYRFAINKENANKGCNVCPICGEARDAFKCDMKQGILGGCYRDWHEGIFHIKSMRCDCYECLSCGTQWESEPYE